MFQVSRVQLAVLHQRQPEGAHAATHRGETLQVFAL